jgi:FAD binding domain-containing protein/berberine-like enzyme
MALALSRQTDRGLDHAAVTHLRKAMRGALLQPSDPGYGEARTIWNAMIPWRPALIARVSGTADVITCVNFARQHGLPLSIRGGGHNVAGTALCEGGLMIDMSQRRTVHVDPVRRIVRSEGGATWGDVDHETQPFGLVVPGGIVSATGVAGFTMGGGFGWTSRKFGYAADSLVSADVVMADGERCRASATENGDLFWALRGGGGNFGAVTSFEFAAHPHGPQTLCGMVVHPLSHARAVMEQFRQLTAAAPDELCCLLILRRAPAAPYLPREVHGKPVAAIAVCWIGDPADGRDAVSPLKAFGTPLADTITPKPFIEHQTMLDAGQPFGRRYYWKSHYFAEIGDGLVDALATHADRITSPHSSVLLMHLGGAPARIDPSRNAVGLRSASYVVNIQAAWESAQEDERHIAWARDYWTATRPFSTGSAYINFMTDDEGEARVRAAYGEQVYARLREVKRKFDPGNLFHGARNIPPR